MLAERWKVVSQLSCPGEVNSAAECDAVQTLTLYFSEKIINLLSLVHS